MSISHIPRTLLLSKRKSKIAIFTPKDLAKNDEYVVLFLAALPIRSFHTQ